MSNSSTVDRSAQGAAAFQRMLQQSRNSAPAAKPGSPKIQKEPEEQFQSQRKIPSLPVGWIQPVFKAPTPLIPVGMVPTRVENMSEAERMAYEALRAQAEKAAKGKNQAAKGGSKTSEGGTSTTKTPKVAKGATAAQSVQQATTPFCRVVVRQGATTNTLVAYSAEEAAKLYRRVHEEKLHVIRVDLGEECSITPDKKDESITMWVKQANGEIRSFPVAKSQSMKVAKDLLLDGAVSVKVGEKEITRGEVLQSLRAPSVDPYLPSRKRGPIMASRGDFAKGEGGMGLWAKASNTRVSFSHG